MKLVGRLLKKGEKYKLQYWGYENNLSHVVETQTCYKSFETEKQAQNFILEKNITLEKDYNK